MLFRDCIYLLSEVTAINTNGFETKTVTTSSLIFANKKSIRQTEFYQAAAQNIDLSVVFEIRSSEYNGEKLLQHDNKQYNIIRTFSKNGEITELVCSDKKVI